MYYHYKLEKLQFNYIKKSFNVFLDICAETMIACTMRMITRYDRYKNKDYSGFKKFELGDVVFVKPKNPEQNFVFIKLGSYDYSHMNKINKDGETGWVILKEDIYANDLFGKYLQETMMAIFLGNKTFEVRDTMYSLGVEITKL